MSVIIEMESIELETPAVKNRCQIEEVFGGPFIELIGLAPMNPVVRGLILSQTRKLPGPECETFEQIKDWVETTCHKIIKPPAPSRSGAGDGFAVNVEFSETEHGRAHYSVARSGNDEFKLDADELLQFVQEAIDDSEGIAEIVDKIAELIGSETWERCETDLDSYGDYDYDDHDCNDTTDSNIEFSRSTLRDRLLVFLREHHPELLEELT